MQRLKSASELGAGESSPCNAINAQKRLERAMEGIDSPGGMIRYHEANDACSQLRSQCRLSNGALHACHSGCDISSKAIAARKGYDR